MASSPTSSTAIAPPRSSGSRYLRSAERFTLTGRSARPDPRVNAYRADLADITLASRLFAPHYARAEMMSAGATVVTVRASPGENAPPVTELARGEGFARLDEAGDWAWGYCSHDHYVGYVPAASLSAMAITSHVVDRPAALVFAGADIKAPVRARWPLGTRFDVERSVGDFLECNEGFVHHRHARPVASPVDDPIALAVSLVGTPYRWGGRGGDGIDCSGLVQRVLGLGGTAVPRDSDQQRTIGVALASDDAARRGDLVFLPGHVGLMVDDRHIVHANAYWMAVTVEPLADVLARAEMPAPSERRRLA